MNPLRKLFPEQASTIAGDVDLLFYALCAMSIVMTLLLGGLIFTFAVRYRRRKPEYSPMRGVGVNHEDMKRIEYVWIGVPLIVFLGIFYWGAKLFAAMNVAPADATPVYVVGKQWMWKLQHVSGHREINELHVPVGRPTKLVMTSEDVIHSFYVPAFRLKTDVLPGRYTTMWFTPTKTGEYPLYCAEYCGTKHSQMLGKVIVMELKDFQSWLSQGATDSLAEAGEKLFNELGCQTCHNDKPKARGPDLRGIYNNTITLRGGASIVANEDYLRESILEPQRRIVAGYQPVMPTYVAQLNQEKVIQLIAYIKTLEHPANPAAAPPTTAPAGVPTTSASHSAATGGAPPNLEDVEDGDE